MKKTIMVDGQKFNVEVSEHDGNYQVTIGDRQHTIDISKTLYNGFRSVLIDCQSFQVNCDKVKDGDYLLTIGHYVYEAMFREAIIEAAASEGESVLTAPMPGLVAEVKVSLNDTVKKGQPLLILEAMKMQNEITAKTDGIVAELAVKKGDIVSINQKLAVIESKK